MSGHESINEAAQDVVKQAKPQGVHAEGYYGLPMLKRPLWGWEIAFYFFAEGISAGSLLLATAADLTGGDRYRPLIRNARYLSLAALFPCPPLLIADLGKPSRFHHMLRIVKLSSPMSLGAWALLGMSIPLQLMAAGEFFGLEWMPMRTLSLTGIPFALFMVAYPGVLLSTTSIPVWARTRMLGALLATSSMAAATSALAIATALDPESDDDTRAAIHRIESITNVAEAVALAGYVYTAGPAAKPLTRGRYKNLFRYGAFAAGIALPALISLTRRKPGRTATIVSGALSLGGALALKWAIVHAGHDSALDEGMNRYASRADASTQGWAPPAQPRTGVMTAAPDEGR